MKKYVELHDKDDKPVYINPEMVVAVYKSEKRLHTTVYTIWGAETPFFVKESFEEVRDAIWGSQI